MSRLNESHWIYGMGAHIHFPGGGEPVGESMIAGFATAEGCAAISDDSGNLLFYTDGSTLWDTSNTAVPTAPSGLGGDSSSTHAAIIVPPAGGGTEYHVFAVGKTGGTADLITHSSFSSVTGTVVAQPMAIGTASHSEATERLAATSHADCDKYWVAAQNQDEELMLFLVKGDVAQYGRPQLKPPVPPGSTQPWAVPHAPPHEFGQMKFSPNGEYLAYCDALDSRVVLLRFNSSFGIFTEGLIIDAISRPYGLEFSPNSKLLYYANYDSPPGELRQLKIPALPSPPLSNSMQYLVAAGDPVGQLQLGPNDKIYGVRKTGNAHTLAVIEEPDQEGGSCIYTSHAKDANNSILLTGGEGFAGLPTFTRIADRCLTPAPNCDEVASNVDHMLWDATTEHHESMQPCEHDHDVPWPHPTDPADCEPLRFERPQPSVYITHSDSECDCLESDDVEVMNITVCNRYSNITLTDLTIQSIEVVGPNGGPPTPLPDGSPSVEVAPIGPFCFGDIAPCSCVSRQFVVRLRGAKAGTYKLKITAMCFAWQVAESQQRCFEFEVCAD